MLRAVLILLVVLSACARFPEVDTAQAARGGGGATPALAPIDGLIGQATPALALTEAGDALAARAADLEARAAAMRGPVQSAETRTRLAAAIAAHPIVTN
jgi:hypothetical protein